MTPLEKAACAEQLASRIRVSCARKDWDGAADLALQLKTAAQRIRAACMTRTRDARLGTKRAREEAKRQAYERWLAYREGKLDCVYCGKPVTEEHARGNSSFESVSGNAAHVWCEEDAKEAS